jgi:hypothetical protein
MAQALWGAKGWRDTLRTMVDHARHREYDEITRKIRMRLRRFMFPEAAGPGARSGSTGQLDRIGGRAGRDGTGTTE